jgi:hypothetical protein
MKKAKDFLYQRLVIDPDGFHDHEGYVEQMSEGYEEQIVEAMESYAIEKNKIPNNELIEKFIDWAKNCGEDAFYIFENTDDAIRRFNELNVKHDEPLLYDDFEKLLNENDLPFNKIEDADYLAEWYYNENVILVTKQGEKLCNVKRTNARQPDGEYSYYFVEAL